MTEGDARPAEDPSDVLVRAIVGSQAILASYLEPGGISEAQAINLLLGVLDHRDVAAAVAEMARRG